MKISALDAARALAIPTAWPQAVEVHAVLSLAREARTRWIRMDDVSAQFKRRRALCGEAIARICTEQKDLLVDALPVLHPLPRGRRS